MITFGFRWVDLRKETDGGVRAAQGGGACPVACARRQPWLSPRRELPAAESRVRGAPAEAAATGDRRRAGPAWVGRAPAVGHALRDVGGRRRARRLRPYGR